MRSLSDFKSIICLNGDIPSKGFFELAQKLVIPIIGVDGGANKLISLGITPDFVVGDLDSFNQHNAIQPEKVVLTKDQSYTDFEKTIFFLKGRGIENTLVVGIGGGEIDHIVNNVNTFVRYASEFDMWFYDTPASKRNKVGIFISDNLSISPEQESTLSLFAFDHGKLKTEGLKWNLDSQALQIMEASGARNKVDSSKISISTTGNGVLVVLDGDITHKNYCTSKSKCVSG